MPKQNTRTAAHRQESARKPGRPPKYSSPQEMQAKIDQYFVECDRDERPYTVAGMAYYLGFASRGALYEYTTRNLQKEQFHDTIKRGLLRIEVQRSEMLVTCKGNPGGMIFDLKNNFGWKDQQAVEVSGADGGPVQVATGLVGMPPRPKDMEEWSRWYQQELGKGKTEEGATSTKCLVAEGEG